MKSGYLYRVVHRESGRDYVGITVSPKLRWYKHVTNANTGSKLYFHNAIRKYGKDAFDWQIIAKTSSLKSAAILEKMARFLGTGHYNMTDGGEGSSGRVTTDESRVRYSLAKLGKKKSPEHIAKMRLFRHTEEAKAAMSIARKGRKQSQAFIDKRAAALKGHKVSTDARRKIGDAARNAARRKRDRQKVSDQASLDRSGT